MTRQRLASALLLALWLSPGCATLQPLSRSGEPAYEVSLAVADERMAVAWHGGGLAHSAIWLRFVTSAGNPNGPVLQLTDADREAYEPDLQFYGQRLAVAWYEKEASSGALTAWLACLDEAGRELWRRPLDAVGGGGRNPLVRVVGQELVAVWIETAAGESPAIWAARFDAAGRPLGAALRIAAASTSTWNLNGAVDESGRLYVVYDAALGTRASELRLARLDGGRIDTVALGADDGHESVYPDIAIAGEHVAIGWLDTRDGEQQVYLYVGALADLPASLESRAVRVTHTIGSSFGAYLAWNGSQLGLAWCEAIDGAVAMYVQRFGADGLPLNGARRLNPGATRALIPSIRPWKRGFAIAWNDYLPGDSAAARVVPLASRAELRLLR